MGRDKKINNQLKFFRKFMSKKYFFLLFFGLIIFLPLAIYSYFLTPPSVQEARIDTDIQYQGATEGQYSDYVILSAQLTEKESSNPLSDKTVKFISIQTFFRKSSI